MTPRTSAIHVSPLLRALIVKAHRSTRGVGRYLLPNTVAHELVGDLGVD
jgi:hypothetical protein